MTMADQTTTTPQHHQLLAKTTMLDQTTIMCRMTIGEFLIRHSRDPILLSAHNVFEFNCAILGDASKNMRPTRNVLVRDVPGATIRADMGFVSIRRQRQISTTATGTRAQCHRFP